MKDGSKSKKVRCFRKKIKIFFAVEKIARRVRDSAKSRRRGEGRIVGEIQREGESIGRMKAAAV
jgi:hypothetical protein